MLALVCANAVLSVWADFYNPAEWTFKNYSNLIRVERDRMVDGRKCLYLGGAAKASDTAWYVRSGKFEIPDGKRSYAVRYEASASRSMYGTEIPRWEWRNETVWFDAAGKEICKGEFPAAVPEGRFSTLEVVGPIPSGAKTFTIQIGTDQPNINPGEMMAFRGFELSFSDRPVAAPRGRIVKRGELWPEDDANAPAFDSDAIAFPVGRDPGVKVSLRDDGVTLVDGKPFFPIGIYAVCKREFNGMDFDKAFRDLGAAGFNFAQTYGDAYQPDFLAAAHKYGFKLWVKARIPDEKFLTVGRFNPDIIAWYLGDDTADHETPVEVRAYNRACKIADPYRLTCQADPIRSFGPHSRYADYVTATDAYIPEIYSMERKPDGFDGAITCVAEAIRDVECFKRDAAQYGLGKPKACWPVLQAFRGWSKKWYRYPTRDEIFAMAFASVIHGAHGLVWYTYGGFYSSKRQDFDEGITSTPERWWNMSELAGWLKELSPALVARTGKQPPSAEILEGPQKDPLGEGPSVTGLLKRDGGKAYFLTVNASMKPVKARFALSGVASAGKVMREGRDIRLVKDALTDEFAPFAVHVYVFDDLN